MYATRIVHGVYLAEGGRWRGRISTRAEDGIAGQVIPVVELVERLGQRLQPYVLTEREGAAGPGVDTEKVVTSADVAADEAAVYDGPPRRALSKVSIFMERFGGLACNPTRITS